MADEHLILKDRNSAAEAIRHLGEEDLRFLNRLIVERLKLIAQAQSTALMSQFNIGDRVGFRSPSGEWKNGIVQKLNKKTISILTDKGHRWNVSPGLLSPAGHPPERTSNG
ncbi:MAG TPA: hypothetical protein ENI81_02895 [Phycisphaerales bacterium]|nr:hypothetical protein [Phycisphaerales bacterium]